MKAPCAARPVIGVLCSNELHDRAVQVVASRFIDPLARIAGAGALLVPALSDHCDAVSLVSRLDGLLLTGSRTHVSARRYGGVGDCEAAQLDEQRDEVALALAGAMIDAGRPVFGICRGFQEINVLFGGSLSYDACAGRHHAGRTVGGDYDRLFDHAHDVDLIGGGLLAQATGARRMRVNSVHEQGIDRLGGGLAVEARATDDGLIEAVSARPNRAAVLGVQWHPEWGVDGHEGNRALFSLIGAELRGAGATRH